MLWTDGQHHANEEKVETFPRRLGQDFYCNDPVVFVCTSLYVRSYSSIQHSAVSLSWSNKARERNNWQLEKGVKIPLFEDSIIQIIRDPKHATENNYNW